VFPKARVLISEVEHGFWTGPADLGKAAVPAEMKQGLIDSARRHLAAVKDRLELVQPERELVPGLTGLATPGHTPGHLASGSSQLFITSDVVHQYGTALPHPEWKVGFDTDPDLACETRRKVLDRIAADRLPVLAYHFPFPGLGHVGRAGQGFGWEPVIWSGTRRPGWADLAVAKRPDWRYAAANGEAAWHTAGSMSPAPAIPRVTSFAT
jgi:glyoxylase-like metal-dependent hydrolase (beta-lactamase superfamily II)